jgi:hypothetical protein
MANGFCAHSFFIADSMVHLFDPGVLEAGLCHPLREVLQTHAQVTAVRRAMQLQTILIHWYYVCAVLQPIISF